MTPADQCNYCSAPIRWVQMAKTGANMPVDVDPDPQRGNVIQLGGKYGVLGPRPAEAARARGQQLYLHHAVSCPYAARWQDKKRTGGPSGKKARR
ncbi:MAG: hypothetical protein EPO40_02890 [Myxococcaceae bacterium]|nr:MAG: hypothetical protein EPO40_02890 [Myxococcaceae bacterium]